MPVLNHMSFLKSSWISSSLKMMHFSNFAGMTNFCKILEGAQAEQPTQQKQTMGGKISKNGHPGRIAYTLKHKIIKTLLISKNRAFGREAYSPWQQLMASGSNVKEWPMIAIRRHGFSNVWNHAHSWPAPQAMRGHLCNCKTINAEETKSLTRGWLHKETFVDTYLLIFF